MRKNLHTLLSVSGLVAVLLLSGCAFQQRAATPFMKSSTSIAEGASRGGVVGALFSGLAETSVPIGLVAGAATGASLGYIANSPRGITYRIVNSGIPVMNYGKHTIIVLPSDRVFDVDSSQLRPDANYLLNAITTLVKARGDADVTIAAYTDDVGGYQHNLQLSQLQANRVLSHFWSHGVDFHRVRVLGLGPKSDVASNLTSLGSHFNRRVEIRIHSVGV
jgi:outer membrane protein OmpA-like peptidoglycan-associated protein